MPGSDEALVIQAMSAAPERLSATDENHLMEFLWKLRSGGELSSTQRETLRAIAQRIRGRTASG